MALSACARCSRTFWLSATFCLSSAERPASTLSASFSSWARSFLSCSYSDFACVTALRPVSISSFSLRTLSMSLLSRSISAVSCFEITFRISALSARSMMFFAFRMISRLEASPVRYMARTRSLNFSVSASMLRCLPAIWASFSRISASYPAICRFRLSIWFCLLVICASSLFLYSSCFALLSLSVFSCCAICCCCRSSWLCCWRREPREEDAAAGAAPTCPEAKIRNASASAAAHFAIRLPANNFASFFSGTLIL